MICRALIDLWQPGDCGTLAVWTVLAVLFLFCVVALVGVCVSLARVR